MYLRTLGFVMVMHCVSCSNSAVAEGFGDSGSVNNHQAEELELRLTEVTETRARFVVTTEVPVYAWGCGGLTMRTLEPGRADWIEFNGIAGGDGGYVDGEFVRTLGCDVASCDAHDEWLVSRGWLEPVGQVSVAPDGEPPRELEDAQAIGGDAGADWKTRTVYEHRTLTGRVSVTLLYWHEAVCSVFDDGGELAKVYEGEFDLGE